MRRSVQVGSEASAFLGDRSSLRKTEDLISAAVSQDRLVPPDESVQASAPDDQVVAGSQIQMVGVAQQDFGADRLEVLVGYALDRALRPPRHECGSRHAAMRGGHDAAACAAVGVGELKLKDVF